MSYPTNDPKRKKQSPRWAITTIVVVAVLMIAGGIVASYTLGGGHFFTR